MEVKRLILWAILATGATLLAAAAGLPAWALLLCALAFLSYPTGAATGPRAVPMGPPDGRIPSRGAFMWDGLSRPDGPMLRAFRNGKAGEVGSVDEPASTEGQSADEEEDRDSLEAGSRSYEEFAAGLDAETEEISFLPPYASGGDAGSKDDDDETWDAPGSDSPILGELIEVLAGGGNLPGPRRFALGTVAVLKDFLDPSDLERILEEQRRYPRLRFGDIAVELGLLTREERDQVLAAQREGIFTESEIENARTRVLAYRQRQREST